MEVTDGQPYAGGRVDCRVLGRYQDDGPSPQYPVFCPCQALCNNHS